ncbi:LuxR C-terminal-related transcriptional regulator [Caballeronia sp. KNU42]
MNDVVACESLSKVGRTPQSVAIPCGSPELGARQTSAAAGSVPLVSGTAAAMQILRTGGTRLGARFAHIRLDIERAWQAIMRFDSREALVIADLIEQQANRLSATVTRALHGEIAALRAAALAFQDDEAGTLPAALSALALGASAPTVQIALTVCRSVYWRRGDLKRFYEVERVKLDGRSGPMQAVSALFDLALDAAVAFDQMRFNAARLLAADALEAGRLFLGTPVAADVFPTAIIAQVLYEQRQVDEAEALIDTRMADIRERSTLEGALRAYVLLARIAASRGQTGRALVILGEAEALGVRRGWPRLRAASLAYQVEIEAGHGRVEHAAQCLERLAALAREKRAASGSGSNAALEIARFHTVARVHVALARSPAAIDIASLQQAHFDTVRRGGLYAAVPVALLLVEASLVTGRRGEAVEGLVNLLKLAQSAGLHQTLVDCSVRVAELIEAIVQRRIAPVHDAHELLPYAGLLLVHRQRGMRQAIEPFPARRPNAAAGLSERERLIVSLMGQGHSNKQIAAELCIAPETVKSHAKHLYTKLSVRNRTEAVTLATRLGLIHMPRIFSA